MGQQITFLSPIIIYRFPEDTHEVAFKTEPAGAVIIDDPKPWVKAVNKVVKAQQEVFTDYLESKPRDEKYAELRERLTVKQIEATQINGELLFSITYDLADGPPVNPTLVRDYAAVHLMTCSYLAAVEAVGVHKGELFAFDLDPAEQESIPGVKRNSIFEALNITDNKLLTPDEMQSMTQQRMEPTLSM